MKNALDQLDLGSPLCRYLIVCYGHYTDYELMPKSLFAVFPPQFLVAVIELAFQRLGLGAPSAEEEWCDFHEHGDMSDRKECEERRNHDPDVVERRRVLREMERSSPPMLPSRVQLEGR